MLKATALCMRGREFSLAFQAAQNAEGELYISLRNWGWRRPRNGSRHMGLRHRAAVPSGGMLTYFGA